MGIITSIIIIYLVFVISIFVHELGHYIVAKKRNLKVKSFNVGHGPKIFEFKYRETNFILNLIPFSGSVNLDLKQFLSKKPAFLNVKESMKVLREEAASSFAGILMNLLLSFFALALSLTVAVLGILNHGSLEGMYYEFSRVASTFAFLNILLFLLNIIPFNANDGQKLFKVLRVKYELSKFVKSYKKENSTGYQNIQIKTSYSPIPENEDELEMGLELLVPD